MSSNASPKDPILRTRNRIGGFALAASHDPREYTKKARSAFLARFEQYLDESLSREERIRRIEAARSEYFARLGYASAKARRKRAQKQNEASD